MGLGDWTQIGTAGGAWSPISAADAVLFETASFAFPQTFLSRGSGTIAGTFSVKVTSVSIVGSTGDAGIFFLLQSASFVSAYCYALTVTTVNNNYHLWKIINGVAEELFDHTTIGVVSALANTTTLSAVWIADTTRLSGTYIQVAMNGASVFTVIDTIAPHVTSIGQGCCWLPTGGNTGAVRATSSTWQFAAFATLSATASSIT